MEEGLILMTRSFKNLSDTPVGHRKNASKASGRGKHISSIISFERVLSYFKTNIYKLAICSAITSLSRTVLGIRTSSSLCTSLVSKSSFSTG